MTPNSGSGSDDPLRKSDTIWDWRRLSWMHRAESASSSDEPKVTSRTNLSASPVRDPRQRSASSPGQNLSTMTDGLKNATSGQPLKGKFRHQTRVNSTIDAIAESCTKDCTEESALTKEGAQMEAAVPADSSQTPAMGSSFHPRLSFNFGNIWPNGDGSREGLSEQRVEEENETENKVDERNATVNDRNQASGSSNGTSNCNACGSRAGNNSSESTAPERRASGLNDTIGIGGNVDATVVQVQDDQEFRDQQRAEEIQRQLEAQQQEISRIQSAQDHTLAISQMHRVRDRMNLFPISKLQSTD